MRGKEFLKKYTKLREGISNHFLTTDDAITTRDKWDVGYSGAVLFNFLGAKEISKGSMTEYGWASAFDKPIITIMEDKDNVNDCVMVRSLSGYRVNTLENGILCAKALFNF